MDMVIKHEGLSVEYDLDKVLENLDDAFCLGPHFHLSYEWSSYLSRRRKIVREIQEVLSSDRLKYKMQE